MGTASIGGKRAFGAGGAQVVRRGIGGRVRTPAPTSAIWKHSCPFVGPDAPIGSFLGGPVCRPYEMRESSNWVVGAGPRPVRGRPHGAAPTSRTKPQHDRRRSPHPPRIRSAPSPRGRLAGAHCAPLRRKTGWERWFGSGRRRNKTAPVPIFFPLRPPVGPDGMAPKHSWYCAPEGPHNVQGVTPVMGSGGKANMSAPRSS